MISKKTAAPSAPSQTFRTLSKNETLARALEKTEAKTEARIFPRRLSNIERRTLAELERL